MKDGMAFAIGKKEETISIRTQVTMQYTNLS